MALAKFKEDINERYLDDIEALERRRPRRDPSEGWTRVRAEESDAVALRGTDGTWWDDILVFETGKPVTFETVVARPGVPAHVHWQSPLVGAAPKFEERGGITTMLASCGVSGDLVTNCGNYAKTYRVSFVVQAQPEALPDFAAELAALTAHPPAWTQASFDRFRTSTEGVMQAHKLPADFCDGIREYHLGLFHEQLGEGRFGERLDRAFAQLYPFVPYSRLAALICGYILYRINAFDHPLVHRGLRRLGRVANFFCGHVNPARGGATIPTAGSSELVISPLDDALIAAVEYLDGGNTNAAQAAAERASTARCRVDTQGLERVYFVRAQIHSRQGNATEAGRYAVLLGNSGVASFRALAQAQAPVIAESRQ
jgi:hypothetical protein